MKFGVFDIETYRDLFVFAMHTHDETGHELGRMDVISKNGLVRLADVRKIEDAFNSVDYIVSFNGVVFDLPILAQICADVERGGSTSTRYIYTDAQELITYDHNRNYNVFRYPDRPDWHAKHFDIFKNCLLAKSLKQWEMYSGFRIRELPYAPDTLLDSKEKAEIVDYCHYDVYSTARIFFERCYGNTQLAGANVVFLAQKELVDMYPKDLPRRFDRSATALGEGIIYQTNEKLPPKFSSPLQVFDFDNFDVCTEVKAIIKELATNYSRKTVDFEARIKAYVKSKDRKGAKNVRAEQAAYEATFSYKGIHFGKGGSHFARPGKWVKVFAFDVASMYPTVIERWKLLKTPEALELYENIRTKRVSIKHDPAQMFMNMALKKTLNCPTGAFRSKGHTAYDPAVGEAMCYISQMIVAEAALSCPEFENVIEVNTDSVFVVGEANRMFMQSFVEKLKSKYEIELEEEIMEMVYFRDVNNYLIYDLDGNFLEGKGLDYSNFIKKGHNIAVNREMFDLLIQDKDHAVANWQRHHWRDFVYKYHKSAGCKYAMIGDKPMDHKNYYFLWTTEDCPNAQSIQFSRTLIDRHNGSIKTRRGIAAFDIDDFAPYVKYIDYTQYQKDLDDALELWGRSDLCTTRTTKEQRKGIKSIKDVMRAFF